MVQPVKRTANPHDALTRVRGAKHLVVVGAVGQGDTAAVEAHDDAGRLDVPALKAHGTVAVIVRRLLIPRHGEGLEAAAVTPRVVRGALTPQLLGAVLTTAAAKGHVVVEPVVEVREAGDGGDGHHAVWKLRRVRVLHEGRREHGGGDRRRSHRGRQGNVERSGIGEAAEVFGGRRQNGR